MYENVCVIFVCVPQEVGGTLIGEGRLVVMVMAGAEYEMVSNTWFSGVCHSIYSIPAIIMIPPPISSLLWCVCQYEKACVCPIAHPLAFHHTVTRAVTVCESL
jgi:hypothetical protein